MLAEFFDRLRVAILDAERPYVLKDPALPHDRALVAHKGEFVEYKRVPPDRSDFLEGLGDLLASVHNYVPTDSTVEQQPSHRSIFVGQDTVVCCFGDGRFDRSFMKLRLTERFAQVQNLPAREFTQKEAVQFLRFTLHAVGADALLASLRALNFQTVKRAGGVVQHGKESLGRSIEATVQQGERVPEVFQASVPIFQNGGLRDLVAQVKVAVYLDVDRERVRLVPLADEVISAYDTALAQVASRIGSQIDETVPHTVLLGVPS